MKDKGLIIIAIIVIFILISANRADAANTHQDITFSNSNIVNTNNLPESINLNTTTKYSQLSNLNIEANKWGVSTDEYQHYLHLITNTSASKWYQQLDPAEVLGIMADSDAKRQHFAKIAARTHHDRAERELRFERAYSNAFGLLYGNKKPIATSDLILQADIATGNN